jgi:hypothetical protein
MRCTCSEVDGEENALLYHAKPFAPFWGTRSKLGANPP